MKSVSRCLLLAGLIPGLFLASSCDRRPSAQSEAEIVEARRALAKARAELETTKATSQLLEEKLGEVTAVLQATTDKLESATAHLQAGDPRSAPPTAAAKPPAPVRLPDDVPEPQVVTSVDRAGRPVQELVFPQLPGPDGRLLARDVRFRDRYGRRLVFGRTDGAPLAYDIDDVHPAVLVRLGIDADQARQDQYEIDQQKRLQAEAVQKATIVRQAAEMKLREQHEAARREQARLAEEQRKADAERAFKLQQLEVERQKAEAALRNADAAILRALNPIPIYIDQRRLPRTTNQPPVAPGLPVPPVQPTPGVAPVAPTAPSPDAQPTPPR
jgi:hypothetical protein